MNSVIEQKFCVRGGHLVSSTAQEGCLLRSIGYAWIVQMQAGNVCYWFPKKQNESQSIIFVFSLLECLKEKNKCELDAYALKYLNCCILIQKLNLNFFSGFQVFLCSIVLINDMQEALCLFLDNKCQDIRIHVCSFSCLQLYLQIKIFHH